MKLGALLLTIFTLSLFSCHNLYKSDEAKKNDSEAEKTETGYKPDTATEETMLHPKFDEQKIYGIGVFKIGNTVENTIGTLLQNKKYKIDSASKNYEAKRKLYQDNLILKVKCPAATTDYDGVRTGAGAVYNWNEDISAYMLRYTVDSIEIDGLIATYYRNVLVLIECQPTAPLMRAIEIKYGKPDKSTRKSATGDGIYSNTYYNGDIVAEESSIFNEFTIDIKGGLSFLTEKGEQAFNKLDSIEKQNIKSKTKNL